jgi:hypothetical protein
MSLANLKVYHPKNIKRDVPISQYSVSFPEIDI